MIKSNRVSVNGTSAIDDVGSIDGAGSSLEDGNAIVDSAVFAQQIAVFRLPRYREIPRIDLYMDQLLSYIEESLHVFVIEDEKILTSSMVNNYVKQKLIPIPIAKRYARAHVAYLMVVCLLKQTFSISDIARLIEIQTTTHPVDKAYDYFCDVMEASFRSLFSVEKTDGFAFSLTGDRIENLTPERRLVIAAATSVADKFYVQKQLELDAISKNDIPYVNSGGG